ncbi:2'-5' RNA ligase family protein [Dyadobacter sp. NIV53]|uniref:2'-5' RNA ligase family protein n=1 Tax=Dyadobacter sp. NIV53 TaxID=2861765 RepID=UPI001C882776|nr:2'-5' RNA ligase family protein [Dyadobacter sp. NIV53]
MTEQSKRKPLVATLAISTYAQSYFNKLRKQHFPAERNYLDAHLTLFHALPDEPWIMEDLKKLAIDQLPFEVNAQSIVSLGNGTAFKIASPELPLLHQKLQKNWFDFLTDQDRQKRNFHITIQNKVESQAAKKLQADLAKNFKPFSFTIYGIDLWRYHQGPWEYIMNFGLGQDSPSL